MPAANTHHDLSETRARHERRTTRFRIPEPDETPELAAAYRSLQLRWLATMPGYRELVKAKVAGAAIEANARAAKIEASQRTLDGRRLSQALRVQATREEQLTRLTGY